MRFFRIFVICFIATFVLPALAKTNAINNPILKLSNKSLYVATTGEASLTFLLSGAQYTSDLYLVGIDSVLLNNKQASPLQTLSGYFEAGTELQFKLFVHDTGMTYYTGPAKLNPDHLVHAAYKSLGKNTLIMGFEDLFGGGDKDYDDFVVLLNNVVLRDNFCVSSVPEADTYAMLIAGLVVVGVSTRRKV